MMASLVRHELAILSRDPRALWALLGLAVLILASFTSLSLGAARDGADKRAVASAERQRWVGQGEKDPHSAAHYSIFAFKPPPALYALDPGVTPFVGQSVWLEAHHQNDMLDRPQQGASLLQRAGLASPASLIFSFGPLVAFLLAFGMVAQDRDQGTLRLALGTALRAWRIVWTKVAALWAATVVTLVLPVTLAASVSILFNGVMDGDVLLRLLLWASLGVCYLAVFAGAGIAVALAARDARLALTLLFTAWIVLVLIAPRVTSTAVDMARPLPSSQAVRQQMLDEAPAYWTAEDTAKHQAELLAQYGVARIEDIPNFRMAELDLVERHSHRVFDRVLGAFYVRVADQDRLFAHLGFLSPATAAQTLSAAATGSDFAHHRTFIDFAERYRRDLVGRMNADGMAHAAGGPERHTNDATLWSQIPPFHYVAPRLGVGFRTGATAGLALGLWISAAALALVATGRKLRP